MLAGNGMFETKTGGMQRQPADGRNIVLVAVHWVMHHRVFFLSQMHTYLISSTGV